LNDKLFVIVDYGMGNIQSVLNAFAHLQCRAILSQAERDLEKADAIILPGVGAFGEAMSHLRELGLIKALNRNVLKRKKPFLGICLGMQLIGLDSTENGKYEGLGWIPGHVRLIAVPGGWKLPHIGWNEIRITGETPLFESIQNDFNFYFVHSFQMECADRYVVARCNYGVEIAAAVQHENIFATQFHPEKSQENGLRLLRNFIHQVQARERRLC